MDPRATHPADRAADTPAFSAANSDERGLVAAIVRNDRKAAARFVAENIDAVFAYVRHRMTPRIDLVDDIVQDVFLAALKGLASFHGDSSLRTWLIGIARHKVEDVYRQKLRVSEAVDVTDAIEEASAAALPLDEQIDASRAREKAQRVLVQMPERYALLLLWRYWEHRRTREIADAIGATEKSVERGLARARAQFKMLWLKE